jgi:hypothetical protein
MDHIYIYGSISYIYICAFEILISYKIINSFHLLEKKNVRSDEVVVCNAPGKRQRH